MASQTGTISALQRFTRAREEIDILLRRFFRRAGGPAKNSGRTHPDKKNAFKTRVSIHERAIHSFGGRKKFQSFHESTYTHLLELRIDEIRAANSKRKATARNATRVYECGVRILKELFDY